MKREVYRENGIFDEERCKAADQYFNGGEVMQEKERLEVDNRHAAGLQ